MRTENISEKWTTRELRAYIREETQNLNYRLIDYYESETNPNPVVDALKERLQKLGTGKTGKEKPIGLGLTYKSKSELLQQARALREAAQVDIYTPAGLREYERKEEQQYNTFIKNRPALAGMSIDEYHDLVEAFGALGSHVLEEFGYEELAQIYHSASADKKIDLVSTVKEVQKESRGQHWQQTDLIDSLRQKMIGEKMIDWPEND